VSTDHARVVLAAIAPHRRDLLLYALHHLEPEHFRFTEQRKVFEILERYYDVAGDVLPQATLTDLLGRSGVDESKQLLYEELYADLVAYEPADHEFRYSVDALKDLRSQQKTGEVITLAFEILERGVEMPDRDRKGHEDAREYLYAELGQIDRLSHQETAPEGDIKHEGTEVLEEYAAKKSGLTPSGVMTGIHSIDVISGGLQNGDLALIAAYTSQGKSQLCAQTAWDTAVVQGKNAYIATSETVRGSVRRRLICRHSRLPQFEYPQGLNTRDVRDATLDEKGEQVLRAVVDDLDNNPAYGKMHVVQIPRGATLGYVESKMKRAGEQWEIHLGVIDYIALLKPDRKRDNGREEMNDLLKDSKVMATSFYGGKGLPLLSPWQMSKTAYANAVMSGGYQLTSLADTSEAEKTPDMLVALLVLDDNPHQAKVQFLKNRDGETPPQFTLSIDYRNAYLGEDTGADPLAALGATPGNSSVLFSQEGMMGLLGT
jgi:replicative DNA helicase